MSAARALLLALVMVAAACASTANAGTQDGGSNEGCVCNMSGVVRAIPVADLTTFDPNVVNIHAGEILYNPNGSQISIVYQQSPGVLAQFPLTRSVHVVAVFTPSSSGDGTLRVTATDIFTGLPVDGALVDLDAVSGSAFTSIGIAGGVGAMNAVVGAGTVSMKASGQTDSSGHIDFAINGTASASYRFTATARGYVPLQTSSSGASQLTGTLPA